MNAFEKYAAYYDLIYRDKDYETECDFIEEVFRRFSPEPVKTVLDGGCGTGGHALPLAKRGYAVTGLDGSTGMLDRARHKAAVSKLSIEFQLGDLRRFDLGKEFDACLCMFAVMGYINGTDDLINALRNVRSHLNVGSMFMFDFWNGLAVLRILPSERKQVVESGDTTVIRLAEPELDAFNHLCRVHYHLLVSKGKILVDDITETHNMRFFFPQEISHYLHDTGFDVLKICPFLDIDGKVDENVWNVAVIARASEG